MHSQLYNISGLDGGINMKKTEYDLPKEWLELVKEAMESDITKEEFKIFIEKEKEKRKKHK
jgi:hypothetical protein